MTSSQGLSFTFLINRLGRPSELISLQRHRVLKLWADLWTKNYSLSAEKLHKTLPESSSIHLLTEPAADCQPPAVTKTLQRQKFSFCTEFNCNTWTVNKKSEKVFNQKNKTKQNTNKVCLMFLLTRDHIYWLRVWAKNPQKNDSDQRLNDHVWWKNPSESLGDLISCFMI